MCIRDRPKTIQGTILIKQLSRSGTSAALHYGEAQAAESRKDFVHKMKIVLKELRETSICLKLIDRAKRITKTDTLEKTKKENLELILIFISCIETAKKNMETAEVHKN